MKTRSINVWNIDNPPLTQTDLKERYRERSGFKFHVRLGFSLQFFVNEMLHQKINMFVAKDHNKTWMFEDYQCKQSLFFHYSLEIKIQSQGRIWFNWEAETLPGATPMWWWVLIQTIQGHSPLQQAFHFWEHGNYIIAVRTSVIYHLYSHISISDW